MKEGEDQPKNEVTHEQANEILRSEKAKEFRKNFHRADLLPLVFKLHGKPYSLLDYPQFREMYTPMYTTDSIWMCGRQLGKTTISSSFVTTYNGNILSIIDVNVGDKILSLNNEFKCVVKRVTDKFCSGVKNLYKVKTKLGSELEISIEHRLKTLSNFTALKDMIVGTSLAHIRRGGQFNGRDVKVKNRIILTARTLGVSYEKHPHNKFVPTWVFELSRNDTILFLSKLWETGGNIKVYKGNPLISYCACSRKLIMQISSLLNKFGILSRIRYKKTKCYELRVEEYESQKLFSRIFTIPGKPVPSVTLKDSNRLTISVEMRNTLLKLFEGVSLKDIGLYVKPKYALSYDELDIYIKYAKKLNLQHKPEYKLLCNVRDGDVVWDEIVSIIPAGQHEAWDITVEDTECFILDGIVSHNSLNLSRSEVLDCVQVPYFQLLYIAPLKPQAIRYSSMYLSEAISTCHAAKALRDLDLTDASLSAGAADAPIMKNVMHQTFANGSGIQLTYAKTSSDRARGIYADRIDFDEIQDQLIDNIPIITQSLSQSEWGIRRFTGTAKTIDNTIEFLWQDSSQNEWAIKCSCGYWNIPNMEGQVLNMIQVDGPHCIKCGKLLNVRNGLFVPKYKDKVKTFQGYHVPQIVVPAITENPKKWSRLLNKVIKSPLPIIMQEILGISCNEGSRLITQDDIDRNCVLPPIDVMQTKVDDYIFTVGGVDWGIAEVTSFTVHTIVGIKHTGEIHVLWANRFAGFDPDTVLQEIAKAHTLFKCDLICCDYGMGFDKNVMLIKRFGLPVIQIAYTRQNQLLTYSPTLGYPRWSIDKVTALEVLFWTIKYNGIKFPPKEDMDKFTVDLLSPYEDISEVAGIAYRKFLRNPSKPDDFCNALCYAVLGAFKKAGHSALDMVPGTAMNTGTISGLLRQTDVDPSEILSLQ